MNDAIVKNLNFGEDAKVNVFKGIEKLTKAVSSTLGASGKCVLLEDGNGNPVITKDGVTVANAIILRDPVENMGATLIKEAARKTVQEAGDGTTTATVLAHAILKEAYKVDINSRDLKKGINDAVKKTVDYLEKNSVEVTGNMIDHVATISTNNDKELGKIIGDAFRAVGETGVVMMEPTQFNKTEIEIVDGVQYDKGITNSHFITNQAHKTAELDNPLVLLIDSPVQSIRQIQSVLEYVIKASKPLLIIADLDEPVISALAMNKMKGNIKINVIDAPTYGVNKKDMLDDLSLLTGATVINEDLGDDMDSIQPEHLGTCLKSTTSTLETIIQVGDASSEIEELIKVLKQDLKKDLDSYEIIKLEKRLARLSAKIAIVKVGANSDIELKEKTDRVEDAICATKAAIKEGIVSGGGIALLNASRYIKTKSKSEQVLLDAIKAPFKTILDNAGIIDYTEPKVKGRGLDVVTGKMVNMISSGIIDPLLVTKSALQNAASVATTILSTDCVINNLRIDESNR
ncbi:MAG TPA: chaperonin GroEL [Methanosarcinales archaeon]|jgi:chaperonin GroEL|nr:chaperonin GroEL [Methanosarcinales archaeon]